MYWKRSKKQKYVRTRGRLYKCLIIYTLASRIKLKFMLRIQSAWVINKKIKKPTKTGTQVQLFSLAKCGWNLRKVETDPSVWSQQLTQELSDACKALEVTLNLDGGWEKRSSVMSEVINPGCSMCEGNCLSIIYINECCICWVNRWVHLKVALQRATKIL